MTSSTETIGEANLSQEKIKPPDRNTPSENPYIPTSDIGAPQFIVKHPTFDGRGVTIAIFEDGAADLLSPELQAVATLDGKPTPKIIDVLNAFDPVDDDTPDRVQMPDQVVADGDNSFTYKGVTYITPAKGYYRIGFLDGSRILRYFGSSTNHDTKSLLPSLFPVLWNEATSTVWVDTNRNLNFADEKAMSNYNVRHDIGIFGKDNPSTPMRETIAFIVQANAQHKFVYVNPLIYGHATFTTSVAAGKGFFGGRMNGSAPGAQIISILLPGNLHGLIEGMILTVKHPQVDIISVQTGTMKRLNDGNSTISVIWDRLVEKYKKPIFSSAGNTGPGINSACEGSKVICVGGYINRKTWWSNYAVTSTKDDYVLNLSARGPRQDGGSNPDIIAPGATVFADLQLGLGFTPKGTYPPGYSSGAGTSESSPIAAGGVALLISAAKQSGVPYDAERLRWAIKSSARFLQGYRANEQGNGIINVEAAWEALKTAPAPVGITSQAPVNTVLSRYLKQPNQGQGIYEREGWTTGQTSQRAITFTRTSGEAKGIVFDVRWIGNDGTFSNLQKITLPLNIPVEFTVTISPKTSGVHCAILNLVDIDSGYTVYGVMNTIIAAEQFTRNKGFTITLEGQAEYPSYASYFFHVPTNTSAFKLDVKMATGNARLMLMSPAGKEIDDYFLRLSGLYGRANYQTAGELTRTIANPEPGVWEVIVDNGNFGLDGTRSASLLTANYTLSAEVFGVEASPSVLMVDPAQLSKNSTQEVSFTNLLGVFTGGIIDTSLGSAFYASPTLTSDGDPQIYEINVPPGSESLITRIGAASDGAADLDMYLYDCSGKECKLKDISTGDSSQEAIAVINPASGRWKVVIDPVSIPSGKTSIEYVDIFLHSAFGLIKSTDGAAMRNSGTKWTGKVSIDVEALPAGRRYLAGVVEVTSEKADTVAYVYNVNKSKQMNEYYADPLRQQVPLGSTILRLNKNGVERLRTK